MFTSEQISITVNGKTYTCPFEGILPPLTSPARDALKADIQANGIRVPIVVTPENEVRGASGRD